MKKFIAMENLEVPTVVDKFMEYIWKEEGYPRTLTDWAQLLPLAEFEANSAISTATGLSPFLATKGRQPRSGLEPAHLLRPLNNHPTIAQQQRNADALASALTQRAPSCDNKSYGLKTR
ncbi:uncharacterized protein PtrM4_153980 [Pyrenophora tritici-repentis]|uniref:Uncharacterized protein n=1 Tax=Pyrenophora tritici-repentis TaxID=45151 RepID=A0A834RII0_9PLEO|nr:hypothetical protein PtrM4_153980 [Pyrenophora tritici-repentis]